MTLADSIVSSPAACAAGREGDPDFRLSMPQPAVRSLGSNAVLASGMHDRYAVYILASRRNGTLYVGVTGNLPLRIEQHKSLAVPGFTRRYRVTTLVYVEWFTEANEAIAREKQLKGWNRAWKLRLIEASNPEWAELPVW